MNLAPVGIAINSLEDGRFIYINEEFSRFTGYGIDELNEMDYWQLTPKKYESQEQKQLNDMAEQGRYGPYQKEYIHKAGHHYPVLLSGIKITDLDHKDYIWSVVQDVTDQKKNEVEIKKAKDKADANAFTMKLANDSAGIGVWGWDLTTNVLVWDEWMYKLYGIPKDRFSGAYDAWENSVHPDDKEYAVSKLEQAIAGDGVYEPEIRVVWPSGEIRVIKASAEVIRDKQGNALKMVGVNYDVTDRVNALEAASKAKQDAENAGRATSNFLANMSHEIRTPMNGVVGMLQVLKRTELTPEQHEQLNIAVSSADSLLVLINDILDFSKIEADKLDIESIEFSLIEHINGAVATVSHLIQEDAEVELVVETSNINSQIVIGDPIRLRQVLTNLVSNAIKFTESGEIRLKASLEEKADSAWCFKCSVQDTGVGIENEDLKGLFNAFTQADVSTTRKYGGTGFGLSICKNLCELMGGSITATSVPGKGSCFAFEIELGMVNKESLQLKSSTQHDIDNQLFRDRESKSQKILLVEDNKVNQLVAEHMLLHMGLEVDICENGVEAIDALQGGLYSLVLMDCQMPEMDGYEATRRIRRGEAGKRYKHIPIIAMTANAMQGDREMCIEAGMDNYIPKPVEESVIRGILSKTIVSR